MSGGALAFLVGLVIGNHVLFRALFSVSYPEFWLRQGSAVALSLTIISLVWNDLDRQHPDLVAAHPGLYVRTCFLIMSGVFLAITNSLPRPGFAAGPEIRGLSAIRLVYDTAAALLLYLLTALLACGWLVFIALAMYFTTLFTGAPARLALRSPEPRYALEESSTGPEESPSRSFFPLTFSTKPVTVTAALTSLVLWLVDVSPLGEWIIQQVS